MRNISDKNFRGNQNKHFMFNNIVFEYRAFYEIMWKNIVEQGRPQMIIWRMHITCRTAKATDIQSEYVKLIDFLLQQWLHKSALPSRFYVHCVSGYSNVVQELFLLSHSFLSFGTIF